METSRLFSSGSKPDELLALEQWFHVVKTGQIAVDVLERIVAHVSHHLTLDDPGQFARKHVLNAVQRNHDAFRGVKLTAMPGDWGYGEKWPLAPTIGLASSRGNAFKNPVNGCDALEKPALDSMHEAVPRKLRPLVFPLARGFVSGFTW